MLGALIALPVLVCILCFIFGVAIDHERMTFYGYAAVTVVLSLLLLYVMLYAWVPLLEAYIDAY